MADERFFQKAGSLSLGQLAAIAKAEIIGSLPHDRLFHDVAPLGDAGPEDVSFLDNRRYVEAFQESRAGVVIVAPDMADKAPEGMTLLVTARPYMAYAHVAAAFYPPSRPTGEIHPSAVIEASAVLGEGTTVGPYAVVGAQAEIGEGCWIGPHAVIGAGVKVGAGTVVGPHTSLSHCFVGAGCQLHAGVRVGNRGFGFAIDPAGHVDVPQLGRVIIEDGVEIGANATVDRGTGPDTVIGAGTKIDNLVQIGHNVQVGRGSILVAQSGVAGSTILEDFVALGAQAGVAGHLRVGQGAQLAAQSGVMRDIPAGQRVAGAPAIPVREFFRLVSLWHRQIRSKGK